MSDSDLLEIIGEGCLYLSSNGQGFGSLESDQIARANRPPVVGWCDTCHLGQYEGTDFFQWHGRRADGYFHPYGKIMRLTEAGHTMIDAALGK